VKKIILCCPQRKPKHLHEGFRIYQNPAKHKVSIIRCSMGHLDCLRSVGKGEDVLIFEDDIVPVHNWEGLFHYGLMKCREMTPAPEPFMFSLYATADMGIKEISDVRPYVLPESLQDWGQQGMYYSPSMVPMAIKMIELFLMTPLRPILGWKMPAYDGFDYFVYKASRLLKIPIYYWPLVQHDHHVKSAAQCPSHHSELLPEVHK